MDFWARVGVVCGALLAAGAVLWKTLRGLLRMWHLMRKANAFFDDVHQAGGPAALLDRLEGIEAALSQHLAWHGYPGGAPARPVRPYPNGDGRTTQPGAVARHRR